MIRDRDDTIHLVFAQHASRRGLACCSGPQSFLLAPQPLPLVLAGSDLSVRRGFLFSGTELVDINAEEEDKMRTPSPAPTSDQPTTLHEILQQENLEFDYKRKRAVIRKRWLVGEWLFSSEAGALNTLRDLVRVGVDRGWGRQWPTR